MKKILSNIIIIGLILGVGYYFLKENGYSLDSILNKTKTYELKADCSNVESLLLTSVTQLTVTNSGNRDHNGIIVRITAFDKNNDLIRQKNISFERTLIAHGTLSKPITLPSKTVKCNCVILDSNPD